MSLSSVPCACNSVALLKIFTGIVRFVGDHPSRLEDGESQRSCSVKRLALDKGPAARSMAGNTQGKHPNSPKRVWCLCLLLAVSFRHHRCRACLRPSRLRHSYRCRRRSTTTSSLLTKQLADRLHVKVSTIWEWTRRRQHNPIPHYPVSRKVVYYKWNEVRAWIEAQRAAA